MSHRDVVSGPLLVAAFTSGTWLPFGMTWSELGTGIMWVMGMVLISVQIRYYWMNAHKK